MLGKSLELRIRSRNWCRYCGVVDQAAGRVFRRPEDKDVVILVDDRFNDERYQELLPPDWFMPGRPFSTADYREALAAFWEE